MTMLQMIYLCWGLASEPENICPPLPIEQFFDHLQGYDLQNIRETPILADFSHGPGIHKKLVKSCKEGVRLQNLARKAYPRSINDLGKKNGVTSK